VQGFVAVCWMSELDQSVHFHSVPETDRDGSSIKVVRLQSEARHWIVRQYRHVHVLRRGTTGLLAFVISMVLSYRGILKYSPRSWFYVLYGLSCMLS